VDKYWNKERLKAHAAPNPIAAERTAIIKECARFADEYVSESFGVHYSVGDAMKKHFGIEEDKK